MIDRNTRRLIRTNRNCAVHAPKIVTSRPESVVDNSVYSKAYNISRDWSIDWRSFADRIYVIRSCQNTESDRKLEVYGIPSDMLTVVYIDTKATYSELNDPLGIAILDCIRKSHKENIGRSMVFTDDFYLVDNESMASVLKGSLGKDFYILNGGDITNDCFLFSQKAAGIISGNLGERPSGRGIFARILSAVQSSSLDFGISQKTAVIHAIDYVFPYVDSSDKKWQDLYQKHTCVSLDKKANRYRGYGTLQYHFRGIDRYMPFVRTVHLILQQESQVPQWLDTGKVHVVFHRDFIPSKHLPTFNSCTIESFIPNIDGMAEHVIYANDDFYPINPMVATDFFINGIPQFITKGAYGSSIYRQQCRNSYKMATKEFNVRNNDGFQKPSHISTPMLKRCMRHIMDVYGDEIDRSVSSVREGKNINQYVFSLYQKALTGGGDTNARYLYADFSDIRKICSAIEGTEYKMVCINDANAGGKFDVAVKTITKSFEKKLYGKSRFENN